MKFLYVLALFVIAHNFSLGQSNDIFRSQAHIGYSVFQPNFGKKPYESIGNWQGFEFNNRYAVISFHQGSVRNTTKDSTFSTLPAQMVRFSGYLGKSFNLGKSPSLSMGIEPYVLIGGTLANVPNKIVDAPITSFGLHLAPGITARFSHFSISLNYNVGTYLSTNVTGRNWEHTDLRRFGFMGGWQATFAIDSGFDILFPKEFTFKGYNIAKNVSVKEREKWDSRGRYLEITTTTTTSYTPATRTLTLVSPFWGIGPYRGFYSQRNAQAATAINGINTGFRAWYFQIDGFYGRGSMGLKDQTDYRDILMTYPQLRDYDFSSQVGITEYGLRVGVNIGKFFAFGANFESSDDRDWIAKVGVPFLRFHGNFTYGRTEFNGLPTFTYDGAETRINDFQAKNDITPSIENNPLLLPESSTFTAWGANIEIGTCFFQMTWYRFNEAPVANHMHYSIGANYPVLRFFNAARTRLLL